MPTTEKNLQKKQLLTKKGYAFLEDTLCSFKDETIFGSVYIETLPEHLLQAIALLDQQHPEAVVPNRMLGHVVETLNNDGSPIKLSIEILHQVFDETFISQESLSLDEDIIDIALLKLDSL